MRKIKVVVLLVQQLQHGFTKNAKVSPNLTVAQLRKKDVLTLARISVSSQYFPVLDCVSYSCARKRS